MNTQTDSSRTVACDICGSDSTTPLFQRGRGGEPISVVACNNCGFCFLSPRRNQADIARLYCSGDFSLQARGTKVPSGQKIAESELAALQRFARLLDVGDLRRWKPRRCLEIGCGIGSFLRLMRGLGCDVTGLEPDAGYASFGSQLYGVDIDSRLYEHFSPSGDAYDLVAAFHVLEHVDSPTTFLQRIFVDLQPAGRLYLELPCIDRPYGGDLEKFFWSSHVSYFSRNTLDYLLGKTGFAVQHTGFHGDFLWVLAEKSPPPVGSTGRLPLDDPIDLSKRLAEPHRRPRAAATPPRRPRSAGLRLAHKLRNDPKDLFPAIRRSLYPYAARIDRRSLPRDAIIHVGMHSPTNAGDTLLYASVREVLRARIPGTWVLETLWDQVSAEKVAAWNKRGKALVVGGGGLFLSDTNPNDVSGWQWPCSVDRLAELQIPLVLFAVGYNRFRNQPDFSEVFKENIVAMVRKAAFVGIRNSGSIRALREYLPPDLHPRLAFQPCPTTVLTHLDARIEKDRRLTGRRLALNLAFDRHSLRFQGDENLTLDRIAKAVRWAEDHGWLVDLVSHLPLDATAIPWLVRNGVTFRSINLHGVPAGDVVEYYRDVDLTIGMRGHAQMLPFGVGNAIVSLVSHDKLSWFLEDIGHPEWGVDIRSEDLQLVLQQKIDLVGGNLAGIRDEIASAKNVLWEVTQSNLDELVDLL